MFVHIFFYIPQALVAVFFNGPTGIVVAWIGCLQQAGIISRLIIDRTVMPGTLTRIFDVVLRKHASDKLLSELVVQQKREAENPVSLQQALRTGYTDWAKSITTPYYWLKFFIIVFFNMIPFFGPYVLIFLRSPSKAKSLHSRYFQIKAWDAHEIQMLFNSRRADYIR